MPTNPNDVNNALDGTAQATLISGVCNSILLFCGLLIAGTFTVVTSSRFAFEQPILVAAIACVFGFSFLAGIVALIGVMKAHNLARRAERLRLGLDSGTWRVDSARRLSVWLSVSAFYLTIGSSLAASVAVAIYLFNAPPPDADKLNTITISKTDGQTTIMLSGIATQIRTIRDGKTCKTVVPIDQGQITVDTRC